MHEWRKLINYDKYGHNHNHNGFIIIGKGKNAIAYADESVVIKIYTISENNHDRDLIRNHAENFILKEIKKLIDKKGGNCYNLLYLYKSYKKNNIYTFITEKCDETLATFMERLHTKKIYYSMMMQILQGLRILQQELHVYHGDLSIDNIYVKHIDSNVILKYDDCNIMTYGYLFIIGDFGNSKTTKLNNDEIITKKIASNRDLRTLVILQWHIIFAYMRTINIITLADYYAHINKISHIDVCKYEQKLGTKAKDKKLIYYILDKGYFPYEKIIPKKINVLFKYVKKLTHHYNNIDYQIKNLIIIYNAHK